MTNAESILVVTLSVFLAVFLLCGIILLIRSIQVVSQIKRITDKAEGIVDKAESVGEFFRHSNDKFALGRLVTHIASTVFDRENKSNKRRK